MGMGILQHIPLAALDDVLKVALPFLFMILWVVGQLLASKKQSQPRPKQPDHPRPNPQPPQPGPLHEMAERAEIARKADVAGKAKGGQAVGGPIRLEEKLRIEVDEFLRRARGEPRQRQPQRPDAAPLAPNRNRGSMDRTHQGKTPPQPGQQPDRHPRTPARTARQPLSATPGPSEQPTHGLSVAEHVATHVSAHSRDIGQLAEQLVDGLAQTDERVEARLHQKFDHSVGRLQHEKVAELDPSPGLTHEILQMLAKPDGIRQLIIANEILRRPHF